MIGHDNQDGFNVWNNDDDNIKDYNGYLDHYQHHNVNDNSGNKFRLLLALLSLLLLFLSIPLLTNKPMILIMMEIITIVLLIRKCQRVIPNVINQ